MLLNQKYTLHRQRSCMFELSAYPKQCNVPYSNLRLHPFSVFKRTVQERSKEQYVWGTSYNIASPGHKLGLMVGGEHRLLDRRKILSNLRKVELKFCKMDIKYNKRFMTSHHAFHPAKPTLIASLETCSESPPREVTKI